MENFDQTELMVMGVIIVLGTVATVVYYFARYYFKTHEEDQEVIPALRDTKPLDELEVKPKAKAKVPAGAPAELEKPSPAVPAPKPRVELRDALNKTRQGLFGRIQNIFNQSETLSDEEFEELEEVLYTSDLGPMTVQRLVEAVGEQMSGEDRSDFAKVRQAIKDEMLEIFSPFGEVKSLDFFYQEKVAEQKPLIWMVVGVNGVGKTTTIGKLAAQATNQGLKTLVVAGDTFRAAAEDQLKVWCERAGAQFFSPEKVEDPSAVAFDGMKMANAQGFDLVIVDTAGRLHTQGHLMEQLKKMKRVMGKVIDKAPHEVFLVLDANSGQNALMQARSFHEALAVTGVILTKLDGTAKGGVALGLACELSLPIKLIGVGEGIEDLRPFHSQEFVDSIM